MFGGEEVQERVEEVKGQEYHTVVIQDTHEVTIIYVRIYVAKMVALTTMRIVLLLTLSHLYLASLISHKIVSVK